MVKRTAPSEGGRIRRIATYQSRVALAAAATQSLTFFTGTSGAALINDLTAQGEFPEDVRGRILAMIFAPTQDRATVTNAAQTAAWNRAIEELLYSLKFEMTVAGVVVTRGYGFQYCGPGPVILGSADATATPADGLQRVKNLGVPITFTPHPFLPRNKVVLKAATTFSTTSPGVAGHVSAFLVVEEFAPLVVGA